MSNNLNNLADKAITDDELEQVSGGKTFWPKPCIDPNCTGTMTYNGSIYVCGTCHKTTSA